MRTSRPSSVEHRDYPRFAMEPRTFAGFLAATAAVVVIAVLSYDSLKITERSAASLTHTVEILGQMQLLMSMLKDAETGQ
jgi:CHASE3 domain sensor protein